MLEHELHGVFFFTASVADPLCRAFVFACCFSYDYHLAPVMSEGGYLRLLQNFAAPFTYCLAHSGFGTGGSGDYGSFRSLMAKSRDHLSLFEFFAYGAEMPHGTVCGTGGVIHNDLFSPAVSLCCGLDTAYHLAASCAPDLIDTAFSAAGFGDNDLFTCAVTKSRYYGILGLSAPLTGLAHDPGLCAGGALHKCIRPPVMTKCRCFFAFA